MSTIKNKSMIFAVVTIFATTLLLAGSLTAGLDEQNAFAKSKKSNNSTQGIGQETVTGQEAVCESLEDALASCNNVALSFNLNDGNNAAGQQ
ncbi:MAG: hypothetical protein L0H53_08840 [Candidatus Nitrosocosmicus sp.]|nr:hypothetical protein [Candidatus Nitrosocosmicus sp.]